MVNGRLDAAMIVPCRTEKVRTQSRHAHGWGHPDGTARTSAPPHRGQATPSGHRSRSKATRAAFSVMECAWCARAVARLHFASESLTLSSLVSFGLLILSARHFTLRRSQ